MKLFKNKKAIELSINFLVVIILSIVMLSSGIVLIKNFFEKSVDIQTKLDDDTQRQIESLLSGGRPVVVPINRKTIKPGEGNLFGLGVLNLEVESDFTVEVKLSDAYDKTNTPIKNLFEQNDVLRTELEVQDIHGFDDWAESWVVMEKEFRLNPKENKRVGVFFSIPDEAYGGTYIYTVTVNRKAVGSTVAPQRYGVSKIYVTVG